MADTGDAGALEAAADVLLRVGHSAPVASGQHNTKVKTMQHKSKNNAKLADACNLDRFLPSTALAWLPGHAVQSLLVLI
jgi:hypothetical protein